MIFLDLSDFFHFFRYAAAARRRFCNTTVASQNTQFPLHANSPAQEGKWEIRLRAAASRKSGTKIGKKH